ncbi:FtsX-like permease family protein [Lachnospiraceae bacterium KK002]
MRSRKVTADMISLMSRQSLKSGRMRNIFVMITIVLASALLTVILMFAAGRNRQEKNRLSHSYQAGYYELTPEQAERLKKDERIAFQIQVKSGILSEMDGFDLRPYYVSRLSEEIRVAELEEGRMPENEKEIAVQRPLLEKMGAEPAAGSSVTFTFYDGNRKTFTVSGILKGGGNAKQFSIFFSESYAERGSQLKDMSYETYVKLRDTAYASAGEFKETVYAIGRAAGIERKYVNPSKAFADSLSVDTQSVMIYGLVGMVILLACVLVIYGVFYLSVIGRIHQFGQLRTIGMTRKQIRKFVPREGIILFLRAAPIGILAGGIAGYFIIPDGFSIFSTLWIILLVFLIIYGITMSSVHRPARMAASISPIEALRYVPQDGMKKAGNKKTCRRLTPFGLGVMNFTKNRRKAAVTMMSLALGGILFMTAATYLSSFDRENYARQGYFTDAEFHIFYSGTAAELHEYGISGLQAEDLLGDEMTEDILALDGVKKVREIREPGVAYDYPEKNEYGDRNGIYPLTGEEMKGLDRYLESGCVDEEKLFSGDSVLVTGNDVAEEIFGWRFEVGDSIVFHYYDGSKMAEKEVDVLGILDDRYLLDHSEMEGWFLMPEQAVQDFLPCGSLNARLLVSVEDVQEEAVGEKLSAMVGEHPELDLETLADRRTADAQALNGIFGTISGLSGFIMMFSILSMMNTLITNIVTRKQELAMLESIGMSKSQIRKMLLGESLLLAGITVGVTMTLGVGCGYGLSNLLYDRGAYYMKFQFPVFFTCAYVWVLILVPLLITLISMHIFAKEALVERLRGMEN